MGSGVDALEEVDGDHHTERGEEDATDEHEGLETGDVERGAHDVEPQHEERERDDEADDVHSPSITVAGTPRLGATGSLTGPLF